MSNIYDTSEHENHWGNDPDANEYEYDPFYDDPHYDQDEESFA